ncbi:Ulp1 protease family, C-terminal catalytic domain-containing protein [Carex littledalei]|uniref:Ulp1 protease family, C-terminal catalytic domain-containing protein n=1 Tax=Carex littledalei TaxID=544730 RepID=A0A833QYZ3_9POAL|nr:Ulp1 protease family, C-terminal catalytic domain-containing protein [Carex littledalei]
MDGPSFSLSFSPEVQIPTDDKTKEKEKVDVQKSELKSRPKVLVANLVYERGQGRRRGRKPIPETETNVIEISSQEPEQQKPKPKKKVAGRRKKRVPIRRTMPKRGANEPKPAFRGEPFVHDVAKVVVPSSEWISCILANIFVDPTFESCTGKVPLPDKDWSYDNRDLVSVEVSNVLDSWVKKYFQFEIGDEDYPFKNTQSGLFMTIDQFRDLLFSKNQVGSEAVDIALFIMQHDTPVDEEWFYLEMGPFNQMDVVYCRQRELFSPQFEKCRWLFVPLVGRKHWILAAFDLKNQKIQMYNSLNPSSNKYYLEPHINYLHWVKYFLSWRLGKESWMDVQLSWMETPRQSSQDCAIFVLRCIDCLTRKVPLDFTQEMISAERLLLACRILTDERNEFKFAI